MECCQLTRSLVGVTLLLVAVSVTVECTTEHVGATDSTHKGPIRMEALGVYCGGACMHMQSSSTEI